jgi:CPA1 family monovalent cation:H+ antiporter
VVHVALPALVFSLVLLLIARPMAVWLATVRSHLTRDQRLYLVAIAPRGIVAAAVASLFALRLEHAGRDVESFVPIVFTVICVTVLAASLNAVPLARWLGVAKPHPNGVVFVGNQPWVFDIAKTLAEANVPVLIAAAEVDQNYPLPAHVEVYDGRLSSEEFFDCLEQGNYRQAVVASANPGLAAYAINRLIEFLGRRQVFSLPHGDELHDARRGAERRAIGRRAFAPDATQTGLHDRLTAGYTLRWHDANTASPESGHLVLFVVDALGYVSVNLATHHAPPAGNRYLSIVPVAHTTDEVSAGRVSPTNG